MFNLFWIKDKKYSREPRVGGNALALELPSWLPAASILGCLSLESCILVASSVFTRCGALNLTQLVLRLPSSIDPKASALGVAPYHKLFDFCNCYLYKMLLHNHLPNSLMHTKSFVNVSSSHANHWPNITQHENCTKMESIHHKRCTDMEDLIISSGWRQTQQAPH